MKATVIGAQGFIGRHLVAELRGRGWTCRPVGRLSRNVVEADHLGHVVYCAGVTSDFLQRPWDTIAAHVSGIREIVEHARYDSILYLSSTRVYLDNLDTSECADIHVQSLRRDQLYNLTKLLGENICRFSNSPARIVRLSNVYGPDWEGPTFLSEMIRMAAAGRITLKSNLSSCKDYVSLFDVVSIIPEIVMRGDQEIYNVASGVNLSHATLVHELQRLTGCELALSADAEVVAFPSIDVGRLRDAFAWRPRQLLSDLPELVRDYERWRAAHPARTDGELRAQSWSHPSI